jgi:hypothetical protein
MSQMCQELDSHVFNQEKRSFRAGSEQQSELTVAHSGLISYRQITHDLPYSPRADAVQLQSQLTGQRCH